MLLRSKKFALKLVLSVAMLFFVVDLTFAQTNNCSLNVIKGGSKRWDVILTGTSAADEIIISDEGNQVIRFRGLGDTRINGKTNRLIAFNGNLDDITVSLGGGDDKLTISNIEANSTHGKINVEGQGGDDHVVISATKKFKRINVDLNSGTGGATNQRFQFHSENHCGALSVKGGEFDDIIDIHESFVGNCTISGRTGNDNIHSAGATAHVLQIVGDDGEDEINIQHLSAHQLLINSGDDNDTINLLDVLVNRPGKTSRLDIRTGEGADSVFVDRLHALDGRTTINLGTQNDLIYFGWTGLTWIGAHTVDLPEDADIFTNHEFTGSQSYYVNGGADSDTYFVEEVWDLPVYENSRDAIRSFENFGGVAQDR